MHVNADNFVVCETRHINADWDCFKILMLHDTLKTQNHHEVVPLCIFGSQTFVPISWMCKKRASVSHSSTEAEIISLDAGLRMDGIPALDLCDFVFKVFNSTRNQTNKTKDIRKPQEAKNTTQHARPDSNQAHQSRFSQC